MKRVVSMGRGGTGKTSFVALMTKYLVEIGETPILLIDADPDQNLNEMVGAGSGRTVSEALYDFLEEGGSLTGTSPQERIESRIFEALIEGEFFDLMAIGTKWREGCYCLPNDMLKRVIPELAGKYKYTLIDSPAGLEHLNRRITPEVEDVFDILDSSRKSFDHVERAYRIIEELDIGFENFYLIGGYDFPDRLREKAEETGLKYVGKIDYDESVKKFVSEGKSLLSLPSNSPAYISVKAIMKKAGYTSIKQLLQPANDAKE